MYTLSSFYNSKEWKTLRKYIISERLARDGEIICEYCNKPIMDSWDIIGHHKIHLTEQNVNDLNISLNPDNIATLHHICHNRIHEKLQQPMKRVYIVFGSPSSGKSTYVNSIAEETDLIVDLDRVFECITNYRSPKLLAIAMKTFNELVDVVATRNGMWHNAYIIIANCRNVERLYKQLGGCELIYIDTPKEVCLERGAEKIKKFGEGYKKAIETFFDEWEMTYKKLLEDKIS